MHNRIFEREIAYPKIDDSKLKEAICTLTSYAKQYDETKTLIQYIYKLMRHLDSPFVMKYQKIEADYQDAIAKINKRYPDVTYSKNGLENVVYSIAKIDYRYDPEKLRSDALSKAERARDSHYYHLQESELYNPEILRLRKKNINNIIYILCNVVLDKDGIQKKEIVEKACEEILTQLENKKLIMPAEDVSSRLRLQRVR